MKKLTKFRVGLLQRLRDGLKRRGLEPKNAPKNTLILCLFASWLTAILDRAYLRREAIGHWFAYVSIRILGIEPTLDDVKRAYQEDHPKADFSGAQDADEVLSAAKNTYDSSSERRAYVIDKCKSLLTLASLFLALVGYVLPKGIGYPSIYIKVLIGVAIYLLVHAILLLLLFFDVRTGQEIFLDKETVELDSIQLKITLAEAYHDSKMVTDDGTRYLVNLYKAARFFVFSALFVASGLFCYGIGSQAVSDPVKDFTQSLRGDAELTKTLRGPEGKTGQAGKKGDAGLSPTIDLDQLARRLKEKLAEGQSMDSHKPDTSKGR